MFGCVMSGGVHGIDAFIVTVEADITDGMPQIELVGYLGNEVREAKERVKTALKNAGLMLPVKRITINLSPANIKKRGTGYDLPMAVSLMVAVGEVSEEAVKDTIIVGELMLSGEISGIRGVLPIVKHARDAGIKRCIIPAANAREGAVIDGIEIITVRELNELIGFLKGSIAIAPEKVIKDDFAEKSLFIENDLKDVQGQKIVKRGLEIAAAGLHNVIMTGPPGTGKSMLARCLPGILPPLTTEEALEVSAIYSVAGLLAENEGLITKRRFISPHHTVTDVALTGGGISPRPGLISLAHHGVLFLDEMPEFSKRALEVLRQPLEENIVHVARNNYSCDYPANIMLVGAMNPCPCGMYPDLKRCTCTDNMRRAYIGRLSKPLIDRMDICMQVVRPKSSEILYKKENESSISVRERVIKAQQIQAERFKGTGILYNSRMSVADTDKYCRIGNDIKKYLEEAFAKFDLSARGYFRILKVARTIADLDGEDTILKRHVSEALFYKCVLTGQEA